MLHDSKHWSAIPSILSHVSIKDPVVDVHQRMRKPHFRAVHDAIARALEHCQERRKFWFEDELVQAGLSGERKLSVVCDLHVVA